ncbi:inositol polyphosphate-5-phosphatase A isoform X2 [Folsomia candida]|uniref:inositol polyphosphate-5-phosphatase A isoform X2 n=1 Tax=Folsomia candida TaxID=158441 RepID=UPI000B9001CB|nr:inositol polyphosphate-5-phosphatase A isoform X2 [Folsomia candida]
MVRMFLVTANVGSVFENLEKGLEIWMDEFTSVIRSRDPEFVAIHFQETGGKNYENGSDCIDIFFGRLVERMGQLNFRRGEGFVDSRSDLEHQFTALSNVYFVHERVHPHAVAIWDFQAKCFQDVQSHPPKIYTGGELDHVYKKEKEKFPQNFYPNCKWSRKGFLRTRWRISGKIVDFVNIHLFHDSDNVVAASTFPSEFAESRQRTLNYTLNRLQNNPREIFPLFIFGDFNFRLNTQGVLSHLERELVGGENSNGVSHGVTISTKKFNLPELERRFLHSFHWLKQFDFEGQHLHEILDELNFDFHPTYPFEEDENEPEKFMRTRCPAWCDRILFTHPTKDIISQESLIEYNVLGSKTCMGDHKPVYLTFTLLKSSPQSQPQPPPCPSWEDSSSSSINKLPFLGQSATLVILPDQQDAADSS